MLISEALERGGRAYLLLARTLTAPKACRKSAEKKMKSLTRIRRGRSRQGGATEREEDEHRKRK